MGSPAKQARLNSASKGFTEVIQRGDNFIACKNPGNNKIALTVQVGAGWHYGEGQETDTAWEAGVAPWNLQMVKANYNLFALSQFNSGQIIKWVDPLTGKSITFQPMALKWTNAINQIQQISVAQNVQATVEDDKITWPGAYGAGRDFSYVAGPTRMQKLLKIVDPLPATSYDTLELEFIMNPSSGVDIYINGEMWDKKTRFDTAQDVYFKSGDSVLWSFVVPTAFDSAGNETTGILRLRKSGNALYCSVRFPKSWINNAVFPIYIDPAIDYQTSSSGDDCYWTDGGSTYYSTTTTFPIGRYTYLYKNAMRFVGVTIPDGATIDEAYISIYYHAHNGTPAEGSLNFEDAADPTQITNQADGQSRTLTTASIGYTPPTSGTWNNSPSIIPIIEELLASNSYEGGAAMQCIITGGGVSGLNRADCRTHNYSGNIYGPKLNIVYSTGEPPATNIKAIANHYRQQGAM